MVKDQDAILLRNKAGTLPRSTRFFGTLLNAKPPTPNSAMMEGVKRRPTGPSTRDSVPLGPVPTLEETTRAVRGMHNWAAPGHDPSLRATRDLALPNPLFSNVLMPSRRYVERRGGPAGVERRDHQSAQQEIGPIEPQQL